MTIASTFATIAARFRAGVPYSDRVEQRIADSFSDLTALVTPGGTGADLATVLFTTAGVPVDYTDGSPPATGEGVAVKGALCIDITNGFVYRNSGTVAQPLWTKLADAA